MADKILVIGATGMLGAPVARALVDAGYEVRALSRDPDRGAKRWPDYEWMAGDVEDAATLKAPMEGCLGAHVNLSGGHDHDLERRGAASIAKAAKEVGISRMTLISGGTVAEENRWHPMIAAKWDAEQSVRASGAAWTIFRMTWFMESLPKFVRQGKAMVLGRPDNPYHWVAAKDYARMVAAAYGQPDAEGKVLSVHGPERVTMKEAMDRYCAAAASGAKVSSPPLWLLGLIAGLSGNAQLKGVVSMMRYFDRVPELGDPAEANDLLGAPTTTLDDWCKDPPPPAEP